MREILFRGKTEQGEWFYGFYHNETSIESPASERKITRHHIYTQDFDKFVIAETIGQFTGLTDKNGKKIFEGDIVRLCNGTYPIKVFWDSLGWKFLRNGKLVEGAFDCDIKHDIEICEVIGNIHDNPELMR